VPAGFHPHSDLSARCHQLAIERLCFLAMPQPFFLTLSTVGIHRSNLLKLGVKIYSYNDHRSAPFSRACWLDSAPPTLLGPGSRHCHGIKDLGAELGEPGSAATAVAPAPYGRS